MKSTFAVASLVLLAALLGTTSRVHAQVGGVVVSQGGTPIHDAVVEAWSDSDRLRAVSTDSLGRFSFSTGVAELTTSLYAYALGFRALRIDAEPGVIEYTLRLAADPISIAELVVSVPEAVCPDSESPEARRLWESLAARYSRAIDTLGMATYLSSVIKVVPIAEIGPVSVEGPGVAQRGSAPLFRASWLRRVERDGYARPLSAPSADGAYEKWGYPPLEADFAIHFVDPVFGKLHRFTIVKEDGEGWEMRFCPRSRKNPNLEGMLKITSDTFLSAVEWAFDTDEPDESAGGRAMFPVDGEGRALRFALPAEGLFWRRTSSGRFMQRYERYEGWLFSPGDSVPFLPVRDQAPKGGS